MKELIDDIMDNFDFLKVRFVMDTVHWKWGSDLPSIEALEERARSLLSRVSKMTSKVSISTGGFRATHEINNMKKHVLRLEFILEQRGAVL